MNRRHRGWTHPVALAIVTAAIAVIAASAQPFDSAYDKPFDSTQGKQYSARRGGDVVQLQDSSSKTMVSIVPSVGDIAFEMKVKGENVLHWPFTSIEEFKSKPSLSGIPLLAPWANRLDEQAFYANGKRYPFDMTLGNVRGAIPIHGFVTTTDQWTIVETGADASSAWLTSKLELFRQPAWMKQWPFAHTIEITHRLRQGVLEVRTVITNVSAEPMPVAVGFHPYFRLADSRRDDWKLAVGARTHWLLAPNKVPTGETEPIERVFPNPPAGLAAYNLDDVFGDLVRDGDQRATMTVSGRSQRLDVVLGPNYRAVVIWAPKEREFVCVEPMAGITDSINLAQRGIYKELQTVAPGTTWSESFWVKPRGF
jgi:aldose 1-epimerase